MPLALSKPRRVPCPPARRIAPTLPFLTASKPVSRYLSLFASISESSIAASGENVPLCCSLLLIISRYDQSMCSSWLSSLAGASSVKNFFKYFWFVAVIFSLISGFIINNLPNSLFNHPNHLMMIFLLNRFQILTGSFSGHPACPYFFSLPLLFHQSQQYHCIA